MRLAIIVPSFNEEAVLEQSHKAISAVLKKLIESSQISKDSFLCFIDDGSSDKSWEILQSLALESSQNALDSTCINALKDSIDSSPSTIAIKLSKNCGHQNALLAGLEYVANKCDYAISIDCDLQDDVNAITEFVKVAKAGAEVILGVRKSRAKDSLFKKHSAQGFYKFMALLGVKLTYNHADYRALSNRAINALLSFKERNLFLRGIVPLLGFKRATIAYDRLERVAGTSKYPLRKMLSFAWNGITSFSIMPLRVVSVLGAIFFIISILLGCYALYLKLFTQSVVSGWTSIVVLLSFFSGIELLSLGIIGEYIGKIYAESKQRPRYFIEDIVGETKRIK